MDKIQRGCLKMSKKIVPCYLSLNFVHNFLLETQNHKWIFGDDTITLPKSQMDFLGMIQLLCQNVVNLKKFQYY